MMPGPGTCLSIRQRKWWASSRRVAFSKDATRTPTGLRAPRTCLITPSLPQVSMPCRMNSRRWMFPDLPDASSRVRSSFRRTDSSVSAFLAADLLCGTIGVAAGSSPLRCILAQGAAKAAGSSPSSAIGNLPGRSESCELSRTPDGRPQNVLGRALLGSLPGWCGPHPGHRSTEPGDDPDHRRAGLSMALWLEEATEAGQQSVERP